MNDNTLQHQLEQLIAAFPGRVFLHAHNLTTGAQIAIDDDVASRCASEAKLFILLTYAEQVAMGHLDSAHRVTLAAADQVPGSGVMRFATPGLQPTASFLAYLMMTVSDNTTTNMLLDVVGGPADPEVVAAGGQLADKVGETPVVGVAAGLSPEYGDRVVGDRVPVGEELGGMGVEEHEPGDVDRP